MFKGIGSRNRKILKEPLVEYFSTEFHSKIYKTISKGILAGNSGKIMKKTIG